MTEKILPEQERERLLKPTILLDYGHPSLDALIRDRDWRFLPEFERIGAIYSFVCDHIAFGYNISEDLPASQVLPLRRLQGESHRPARARDDRWRAHHRDYVDDGPGASRSHELTPT